MWSTVKWREFRRAYPRIAMWVGIAISALILIAIGLIYKWARYSRELTRLRAAMTEVERRRVDAIMASEENRLALGIELARREALGDIKLHLNVDTKKGVMYLEREGARLREMPIRLGLEATVGTPPDSVRLAVPLGKRLIALVVDSSYRWVIPKWVYIQRGLRAPPVQKSRTGALGPMAIFLDSGTIIYSRPKTGPLNDDNYILPGSVRAEISDLEAIRENLNPGMAVYFY